MGTRCRCSDGTPVALQRTAGNRTSGSLEGDRHGVASAQDHTVSLTCYAKIRPRTNTIPSIHRAVKGFMHHFRPNATQPSQHKKCHPSCGDSASEEHLPQENKPAVNNKLACTGITWFSATARFPPTSEQVSWCQAVLDEDQGFTGFR